MGKVSGPHLAVATLVAGALWAGASLSAEAASPSVALPRSVVSSTPSTLTRSSSLNNKSMIIQLAAFVAAQPNAAMAAGPLSAAAVGGAVVVPVVWPRGGRW